MDYLAVYSRLSNRLTTCLRLTVSLPAYPGGFCDEYHHDSTAQRIVVGKRQQPEALSHRRDKHAKHATPRRGCGEGLLSAVRAG